MDDAVSMSQIEKEFSVKAKAIGLTDEMQKMMIDYLESIGALETCYSSDGTCGGSCPSGFYCKKLHNNNCLCVKS